MKVFAGIAVSLVAGGALIGCSTEETVEDRVIRACTDVMLQDRPIGPADPNSAMTSDYIRREDATFLDMSFADLTATSVDASSATEIWKIEGNATAQWEKRLRTNVWDDDGKPDAIPSVTEKFSCEVGHRASDEKIVVFKYTTYHPTSGGSYGRQLVERESSGG